LRSLLENLIQLKLQPPLEVLRYFWFGNPQQALAQPEIGAIRLTLRTVLQVLVQRESLVRG
jgi:hypothetical protein